MHEIAQDLAPASRIVYVDNDPIVLAHARALLASSPPGSTSYVDADVRDTSRVLEQAAAALDFSAPVAVILVSVLHMIQDHDDPHAIVNRLMDAAPPGSFLVLTHVASDLEPEAMAEMTRRVNQHVAQPAPRALCHGDAVSLAWNGAPRGSPGPGVAAHVPRGGRHSFDRGGGVGQQA